MCVCTYVCMYMESDSFKRNLSMYILFVLFVRFKRNPGNLASPCMCICMYVYMSKPGNLASPCMCICMYVYMSKPACMSYTVPIQPCLSSFTHIYTHTKTHTRVYTYCFVSPVASRTQSGTKVVWVCSLVSPN
jgi:hypothetical protein